MALPVFRWYLAERAANADDCKPRAGVNKHCCRFCFSLCRTDVDNHFRQPCVDVNTTVLLSKSRRGGRQQSLLPISVGHQQ